MSAIVNNIKAITITKIESAQLEYAKNTTDILNHRGDKLRQLTTGESIIITGSTKDGDDFTIEYVSSTPIKTKVSINGKEIGI